MKLRSVFGGILVGAVLLMAGTQTSFATLTSEQRLSDFNQLINVFERNYGPLRWKKQSINLDFAKNADAFRAKALAAKSDGEFYRVMAEFLASLRDAHVSAKIPSTYRASLGFLCDLVEGKVLIEKIDTLKLPDMLFPFKKGDQLLAIDGVAVEKIMADLVKVDDTGNEMSKMRIAAARLTSRREASGLVIPRGVSFITVLPKGAAKPVTVTATWIVAGKPLLELDDLSRLASGNMPVVNAISASEDGDDLMKNLKKLSMFNYALPDFKVSELTKIGVADLGTAKSMFDLPAGAKQIDGVPVTAAVYTAGGKKIGILRFPSYIQDELLYVVANVARQFEQEVDVMVLDQTNNPGGSVDLVTNLTSIFADQSFKDMLFEIRPSLQWLDEIQGINSTIQDMLTKDPNDVAANAMKARFEYLESEMRDSITNKAYATKPLSLNLTGTFGMIQPQPEIRFTKPILMLINELDFSGGDAFPAIMKDNGRVTLFGARTSGAGGNVREYGPLANSFFKFSVTESLMVRPNGQYVENLGVSPDIEYKVTEDDFMNGYRGYTRAFTKEALKLVGVNLEAYEAAEKARLEKEKVDKEKAEKEKKEQPAAPAPAPSPAPIPAAPRG